MSDVTVTTEAPTTPPTTTPQGEGQPLRDSTGTLLDQQSQPSTTSTAPTTDGDKPVDPAAKPADKPAEGAITYEPFKAPEGYTIDQKTLDAALPIFQELKLDQASAQKLVDFHANAMIEAAKAPANAYETTRAEWQSKVKADPEMGSKLDTVKTDIGRALALLPADLTAEFKTAMDITGAGDHPAFVKAMWKLSQLVTEGKHVAGSGPSEHGQKPPGAPPPIGAKALYPNLP